MAKKSIKVPFVAIILLMVAAIAVLTNRKQEEKVQSEQAVLAELKETIVSETLTDSSPDVIEEPVEEIEVVSAETESEYVSPYDFDALHSVNEDIVGWIEVPGSRIDYPVCYDGTDEYLHKDLQKEYSYAGTLYVSPISSDRLNVIYGHNMKNGSMFADVDDFAEKPFSDVNIYREDGENHLHPALCVVGKSDVALESISSIDDLASFCADKKIVSGEIPETFEEMTVLVTCNYTGDNYRTYLFCAE